MDEDYDDNDLPILNLVSFPRPITLKQSISNLKSRKLKSRY